MSEQVIPDARKLRRLKKTAQEVIEAPSACADTICCVDYNAYLRTPHWRNVRKRYWASKRPKVCSACGVNGVPLDLHHKTYKRLGKEHLSDLTLMCRPCHDALHRKRTKRKRKK